MFYMQGTKMLFGDAKDTCEGKSSFSFFCGSLMNQPTTLQLSNAVWKPVTTLNDSFGRIYITHSVNFCTVLQSSLLFMKDSDRKARGIFESESNGSWWRIDGEFPTGVVDQVLISTVKPCNWLFCVLWTFRSCTVLIPSRRNQAINMAISWLKLSCLWSILLEPSLGDNRSRWWRPYGPFEVSLDDAEMACCCSSGQSLKKHFCSDHPGKP